MKNKTTKLFFTSLMLLSIMSFAKPETWFLLEAEQYGFKIEFPKEPTENSQVVNSEIGELETNIFTYDASKDDKDDNLTYSVSYTEYPDSLINSEKTENLSVFSEIQLMAL
ncbi:MAG: hypothetical protein K9J27_05940 [Bacteroidales bacterium]|nr:hypothetical protein [Bacteroidales bacterium]MCF8333564.1 hypothetical protein [Bacteroidales bacterium]